MYKDLLPIGSVVRLSEGEKKLMVCGRVVTDSTSEKIHDYVGCFYPEGIIGSSNMFFFEHAAIEEIYFIGFQDQEEIHFRAGVLKKLDEGKPVVKDGRIEVEEK